MFDILVPARIIFGSGTAGRLGEETLRYGQRALLVTGKKSLVEGGGIDRIYPPLRAAGVEVIHFSGVDPEPTVKEVDDGRELVRKEAVNVVIGVGGGSALDVAKAVAGLAREEGETIDYFNGRPITRPGIPFVAVPTTAGSGAEATKNSVLVDPDTRRKQSIRSDLWMARSVIVDPILTFTAPRRVTAHSGMDAFTHAL
ncbi:MAG: iron-containing alcohol dehydrogenase, partial [Clostridia bacterium]|nr:iron-containing alcohol dehydrogenase [Clostridia bacterium]